MIPANNYNFVNVQANLIHNRGTGFADNSPLPTYEDAAYMREIYRTMKIVDGYKIWRGYNQVVGEDWYPNEYEYTKKDNIEKIMPTRERWKDDLTEAIGWLKKSGKFIRYYYATNVKTGGPYVIGQDGQQYITLDASDWLGYVTQNATPWTTPDNPTDGMIPRFDTKTKWNRLAYNMQNRYGNVPLAWKQLSWTCGYNGGASLNMVFKNTGVELRKNGVYTTTTPFTFLDTYQKYPITMFYREKNSGNDNNWSYQSNYYYKWYPPTWTTGRMLDSWSYVVLSPIFAIRYQRMWKGTKEGYDPYWTYDKHFYIKYWLHNKLMKEDLFYMDRPPLNGGTTDLIIDQGDGTVEALGKYVTDNAGLTNISAGGVKSPEEGYTYTLDGYAAFVELAGMLIMKDFPRRDLNPSNP